ncbi:MAG: hypothetical protein ABJK67_03660 [Anderseniella sp.]
MIILICLVIGTGTAGVSASAAPVMSMTQSSILENMTGRAAADAADTLPLLDATGGFRLQRAIGRRADRALRKRRNLGRQGDFSAGAPLIRVAGASSAKRAAERAAGGRAVRVVKKGGRFIVTVVSGGSARRCVVDAKSGQVLGCR